MWTLKLLTILLTTALFSDHTDGQTLFMTNIIKDTQQNLLRWMHNYVGITTERINFLRRFVMEYSKNLNKEKKGISAGNTNPLTSLKLIQGATHDLDYIVTMIAQLPKYGSISETTFGTHIEDLRNRNLLPKNYHLEEAFKALIRLQHTYDLNITDMVEGRVQTNENNPWLKSSDTDVHLSARDCLALARYSFEENLLDSSLEWLANALSRNQPEWGPTVIQKDVSVQLHKTITKMREQKDAMANQGGIKTVKEFNYTREQKAPLYNAQMGWDLANENYRRLCQGERLRPSSWDLDLHCHYSTGHNLYFIIRPLKIELVCKSPYLIVIHDIITESQIQLIKNEGISKLQRSLVLDLEGKASLSPTRTSENTWFDHTNHPTFAKINRFLEGVTGLSGDFIQEDGEKFQVVNYGVGGHYIAHYDFTYPGGAPDHMTVKNGDRIATFMYYLNDVDAGGATVFPFAGLTLWPTKGSAAFWWNLNSNGQGDLMTLHGGCPVLLGSKWVVNKWYRMNGQMFRKPCKTKGNVGLDHFKPYSDYRKQI